MISLNAISTVIFLCIYLCIGCKVDEDCYVPNSVCFKTQCVCPKGYVMNSDMTNCLKVSEGYGSSCIDSVQCSAILTSGGQCINKTCGCADGYHYLKGRCWKTSGLDEACSRNENCYVNYDFESAICTKRKCFCSPGYYQREYSSCRRKQESPGEACLIPLDCDYPGSSCLKNRTCGYANESEGNYVPSPTWSHPLPLASSKRLGGKCSSNADCVGIKYALCNPYKECSCAPGYYSVKNSFCYPEIASYCASDMECIGDHMICRKGKNWCTCEDGYVSSANNRYCTKMSRDIDWSCLSDRWCSTFGPGGVCINKKCHCNNETHYVPKEYFCWVTQKVGTKCKTTEDCGSNPVSEMCKEGICTCNSNFHSSTNKTVCRPDGLKIGDYCQEDLDCFIKNSMCNSTSESCICKPGYMILDNTCVPGVGGKCDAVEKCHAFGSTCNNSTCECDEHHVSSLDYSECLPIATEYQENCTESQQCTPLLGIGGVCKNNCTCFDGYHIVDKFCYMDVALYQNCTKTPECQVGNKFIECRNELCQCMYKHPPDAFNRTCKDSGVGLATSNALLIITLYIMNIIR